MSNKLSERRNLARRMSGVTMPIGRKRVKWGRNWPCLCGSDKKYKNCCINEIDSLTCVDGNADVTALPEDIQKLIDEHNQREGKQKGGTKTNG